MIGGPDAGLWELVEARAAATPDGVLIVDERGRTLTAAGLRDDALRVAAGFHAMGVETDTPVSWMLPSRIEAVVLMAALARLGAVQNPMLPILGRREMTFILGQAGARLVVVPGEWNGRDYTADAQAVADGQPGLEVVVCDPVLPTGDPATLPPPPPSRDLASGPVRWVFYTSGTTADPKGAQHTDLTVRASAVGMIDALEITDRDRVAMVFPITHVGGLAWLYVMLLTGATCIFIEVFSPATSIPVLQREGVTLAGVSTAFHLMYLAAQREQPDTPLFPEARAFPGGAAPKPPQLHYEVKAELGGAGIVAGWGLTEAPLLTMCSPHDTDEQLAETEGVALGAVQLRTVRLDGTVAPAGEEGELRVKGPQVFRGYLDASLDADAFDDDGWFRTGDLGVIDPASGHVRITGRLKDVIIRKGETISAKEVEDALFTHPAIADAAVIGLPDSRSGERVCAVIVPSDRTAPPTLADLFDFLVADGFTKQKVPEQLEVVEVLPRNPTGKVLKHELKAQFS